MEMWAIKRDVANTCLGQHPFENYIDTNLHFT